MEGATQRPYWDLPRQLRRKPQVQLQIKYPLLNRDDDQEPLPEPTATELAKEAEQEAAVFAQAVNVDKLLTMLRGLDPQKDNLADNEEIQVSPSIRH